MTQLTKLEELERDIVENTKLVDLSKALERLMSNRDFKKVITDGYFTAEAVRLVHVKADKEFETPERQASLLRQMDSIGNLASYFNTIRIQGEAAKKTVSDAEIDRHDIVMGNN